MNPDRLVIFGEVLFDHFPGGETVLGGAPFNVAWHLQALGHQPLFISRVGDDLPAETVRSAMQSWGMDTTGLQTDKDRPTGQVKVTFNQGEPAYDIVYPAAFDRVSSVEFPAAVSPSREAASDQRQDSSIELLYHGTLALRHDVSKAAANSLHQRSPERTFIDVNLRSPWWERQQVLRWVGRAQWVKLNSAELEFLADSGRDAAGRFLHEHQLQGLIVTHGEKGATLHTSADEIFHTRPDTSASIVDTVGAGDAFSAVMIHGLMHDWPPQLALDRAQGFASAICQQRGATVGQRAFYTDFLDAWGSDNMNSCGSN